MSGGTSLIPAERIERAIFLIRGRKVLLDTELAKLYGVSVGRLNEAVKRNLARFPEDFMFQLNREEFSELKSLNLISQSAISSPRWGGRRTSPYAFTEQGVAMLSGVLNSPRAVQVNIEIMRAFVRLRQTLATNASLERLLNELRPARRP